MSQQFNTLITGVTNVNELKTRILIFNEEHKNMIQENNDTVNIVPKLEFKEDDDHLLIFSTSNQRSGNEIDDSIKSVIIDKSTLTPIVSQYNKLIYNENAIDFLTGKNWENVTVKYCYEGTMIIVFFSHDKWYVCTRKCLDAKKSYWIKNISYYELFMDAINGNFKIEDLNKDYCYHFILIHHKNRNIVDYSRLGKQYKTVSLAMTTEKYTLNRVPYVCNQSIIYPKVIKFNNIQEVVDKLARISSNNKNTCNISTEGFIIEYFENGVLTILKIQTPIYKYIASIKPNVSNLDAMFLELYQHDKLVEFVPYFTTQCRDVVNRIHRSMKTISNEILNIYHGTRSHKNEKLYEALPSSYKSILYTIHGKYLQKHLRELEKQNASELGDHKSITVYDVYEILKHLQPYYLRKIFIDRIVLINNEYTRPIFQYNNFDALLQGKLMM